MKFIAIGCALLVVGALPLPSQAQEADILQQLEDGQASAAAPGLGGAGLLANADKDKDGKISREEYLSASKALTDGQGLGLSEENFKALQEQAQQLIGQQGSGSWGDSLKQKLISKLAGADGGKLDQSKLSDMVTKSFDQADSNHDGYLDAAEQAKLQQDVQQAQKTIQSLSGLLGK